MGKFSPYVTKEIFKKCRQLCLVWPKSYKICACPWEPKKEPQASNYGLYIQMKGNYLWTEDTFE